MHPKNAEIRGRRSPNVLLPGDIIQIPKPPTKAAPREIGAKKKRTTFIRLAFNSGNKPEANEPFVAEGLHVKVEGKTDAQGNLLVEVPVELHEFKIRFLKSNTVYPIEVGDMEPVDEPSGARKRLQHLGFRTSDAPNEDVEALDHQAVESFQRAHKLQPTGALDDETKTALVREHGS
jgi:hypothetical protein